MLDSVILSTLEPYIGLKTLAVVLALSLPIWITYHLFFSPLCSIPGPLVARMGLSIIKPRSAVSLTWVWDLERLHQQYGPIVRVSCNHLSVSDPDALPIIYRIASPLHKTKFYHSFMAIPGKPSLFSDTDFESHKTRKKAVGPAFAMTFLTNLEESVENVTETLTSRLRDKIEQDGGSTAVEFDKLAHYFAMDAVGEIAVSLSRWSYAMSVAETFPTDSLEGDSTCCPPTASVPKKRSSRMTSFYAALVISPSGAVWPEAFLLGWDVGRSIRSKDGRASLAVK
jgi:hypothetical protein